MLLTLCVHTQEITPPTFDDYKIEHPFKGKPVKVKLDTEEARMFRTRLKEASLKPIEFAGEYVVAVWGCGTSCTMTAVVSLKTGDTLFFPGTICCNQSDFKTLDYQVHSRLLILTGFINEDGDYGRHYYVLRDNKEKIDEFVWLYTQKLDKPSWRESAEENSD